MDSTCSSSVWALVYADEIIQGTGDNTVPIYSASSYNPDRRLGEYITSASTVMEGSMSSLESKSEHSTTSLIRKLFVTWGCGLLFGWGLYLPAFFIIGLAGAAATSFGAFNAGSWIILAGVLGLVTLSIGPILLGTFLAHSWLRGFRNGLVALFAGVFVFVVEYMLLVAIPSDVRQLVLFSGLSAGILGIHALAIILTVLVLSANSATHNLPGLGVGMVIGLGFSFVIGLTLDKNTLHILWETPPLIWVSIVYFPELMARRSGWKGFVIWVLLVLITFGLAFVVAPLFPSL